MLNYYPYDFRIQSLCREELRQRVDLVLCSAIPDLVVGVRGREFGNLC